MTPERSRAFRQLAVSYVAVNALVFALSRGAAQRLRLHELIGALFLLGALASIRADDDDTGRYGVRLGGVFPGREGDDRALVRALWEGIPLAAREFLVAAAVAAVVFPVYAYFWPLFNRVPASRHFALDADRYREILTNLFAVALTEEMYFRGYVQTRLADALGVTARLRGAAPEAPAAAPAGAPFRAPATAPAAPAGSPGARFWAELARLRAMALPVVLASVLFAGTHVVVEVTPARAAVFFPGLLFGALRVFRGGIGAAVFLHAMSNVFELWLEGR